MPVPGVNRGDQRLMLCFDGLRTAPGLRPTGLARTSDSPPRLAVVALGIARARISIWRR